MRYYVEKLVPTLVVEPIYIPILRTDDLDEAIELVRTSWQKDDVLRIIDLRDRLIIRWWRDHAIQDYPSDKE